MSATPVKSNLEQYLHTRPTNWKICWKITIFNPFIVNLTHLAIPGLFFLQFKLLNSWQHINIAKDWIWTGDLWFRKQPLYQMIHNHLGPLPYWVCTFRFKNGSSLASFRSFQIMQYYNKLMWKNVQLVFRESNPRPLAH